jgi:hypothetical protein
MRLKKKLKRGDGWCRVATGPIKPDGRKKMGSIIAGMLTDTQNIMCNRCPQDE